MTAGKQLRTCAFTGHRPQKLSFGFNEQDNRCVRLKKALRNQIQLAVEEDGITKFVTGMAQGVDIWAGELVLELRKEYPQIRLECAVACDTQTKGWSDAAVERYNAVLTQADEITYVQHEHTKDCYLKRDRYMADAADKIIAVWNGTRSGTGYTIEYAKMHGTEDIVIIDPDTARVRRG